MPTVPPADRPASAVPVLLGGLVTTALAVALRTWMLGAFQLDAFTFMIVYVLPMGAFVVGLVAGAGYAAAARATGVRVSVALLWTVVAVQTLAFGAALAAEYGVALSQGRALPAFGPWLDAATRSVSFERDGGGVGAPLGGWGYGLLGLAAVGFVGGSLLPLVGVRGMRYCADCGRYMTTAAVGTLPASVASRVTALKSAEVKVAYEAEQEEAARQGLAVHDHLFGLAQGADAAAFAETARLVNEGTKAAGKLPRRLDVALASCPTCRRGVLTSQTTTGQGRSTSSVPLASADVAPAMVRALDRP